MKTKDSLSLRGISNTMCQMMTDYYEKDVLKITLKICMYCKEKLKNENYEKGRCWNCGNDLIKHVRDFGEIYLERIEFKDYYLVKLKC